MTFRRIWQLIYLKALIKKNLKLCYNMLHWQFLLPALCFNSQADGSWNFTLIEGEKLSARALFPPLSSWCIKRKAVGPSQDWKLFLSRRRKPAVHICPVSSTPERKKKWWGTFLFHFQSGSGGTKVKHVFFWTIFFPSNPLRPPAPSA